MLILVAGTALCLGVFAGVAQASDYSYSTGISSFGSYSPLISNVDARESDIPGTHRIEADFLDLNDDIDSDEHSISVPDGLVWGCQRDNHHISCAVSNVKSGEHSLHVSVKDKTGNHTSHDGHFTVTDKVAPVIDSITAGATGVTVKYHDPSPSSGIASVIVTVDGNQLNCDFSSGGCDGDDDHDGYDDDHDGYDGDHDGYDNDDHDGYDHDHDGYDGDHDGSDCDHEGYTGYYHDSENNHHNSDGFYHDGDDDDHDGSGSNGYTCPITTPLGCGTHEVVVTVTDKAGNVTTGNATINGAGDCEPPKTTDNAPSGWQKTDVAVTLTCTDASSGCAQTTYEVDGGATQTGNTVNLTTDGVHTITYRSQDVAGNVETTNTATVMIDKTAPGISLPADINAEATGSAGATLDYDASASDTLSGLATFSCSPPSGSTFPIGSTSVNCTATDVAGNSFTSSFNVIVADTTPPALTLPGNFTIATPGTSAVATFSTSATDLVDGTDAVTCDHVSGESFPIGDTVVSCSATDSHGNTSTGSFTVTVCQSGRPPLDMICPTVFGTPDFNWKDQAARIMTIRYTLVNGTGPDAYNVKMTSSTADNGVITLTPMPILVGNLISGASVKVAVDYYIPVGVHSFTAANTACADDGCGTTYLYPETP